MRYNLHYRSSVDP